SASKLLGISELREIDTSRIKLGVTILWYSDHRRLSRSCGNPTTQLREGTPVRRCSVPRHVLRCPGRHDAPARRAAFGPEIDDVVAGINHVSIARAGSECSVLRV